MSTQNSNSLQRRNALLRAISLVSAVMLFTGFMVTRYFDAKGAQVNSDRTSLEDLRKNQEALMAFLNGFNGNYRQILDLDEQWTGSKSAKASAAIYTTQLKPLEEETIDSVGQLFHRISSTLDSLVHQTCQNLVITREMVWDCRRGELPHPPAAAGAGNGEEDCKREMDQMKVKLEYIAASLDSQIGELNSTRLRGLFGNKKEAKRNIDQVAKALESLSSRLHSL